MKNNVRAQLRAAGFSIYMWQAHNCPSILYSLKQPFLSSQLRWQQNKVLSHYNKENPPQIPSRHQNILKLVSFFVQLEQLHTTISQEGFVRFSKRWEQEEGRH